MTQLNNSIAYGFSKNVVRPIIMDTIKEANPSLKVEEPKSTTSVFKPINVVVKNGKEKKELSVVIYYGNGVIALSSYNMMYAKNIAFIANSTCYIVDGDALRANWQNIMVKTKTYVDGSNIASEMTYADVNKVIELASEQYSVKESNTNKLKQKAIEYKIAC